MPKNALKHDEIVRYNRMADTVSARTRARIEFLKMRTTELNGLTADRRAFEGMGPRFAAALLDPRSEKDATKRADLEKVRAEAMAEFCELVEAARKKIPEAITELDALWKETIDLYVRAKSNFLMFFRPINLAPNEQAQYTNTYRNEVNVGYVSQDGHPRTYKAVAANSQTYIDLKNLMSDEITYRLDDINFGPDIAAMAQATVDIAWDLDAKVNALAKTMYLTCLGSFTTTGAKLDRTYIPNSHIVTDNLPTTNVITLSGNTGATKFRSDAIRQIMKYYAQWGDVWGEPLKPTGVIMIPSLDATDLSSEFDPTGSANNPTADGIIKSYYRFEWFDTVWTIVPDVTLSPGYAFPVPSQPVGDVFFKPSWDKEFVDTNPRENWEKRSARKAINFAVPKPRRVNAVRVQYRTV